ncbi:MAG: right-handed parallel beta-helix repeat-containing protein [Clostridia bacterium]|nr:right-handed parallel beta-helix repeat-containing protein [Clostridia bacterium]
MIYKVEQFGAVADGVTLCTSAVQKGIDFCSKNGGGTLLFSSGNYVLGSLFLKSNVHIQIDKGVKLLGAPSYYDFAQEEKVDYPIYQDSSHTYFHPSMFVGLDCENISIVGDGEIDMRSVWDEDGVRGEAIKHRGAKCIALKNCKNVKIANLTINNVTDLAVYFAGCENVDIYGLKLRVYIDGISPDNSKNVRIHDCEVEAGDDAIVFKSSYTLNRLGICKDIKVWNCRLKSRCTAIKFGTETNGGFENIDIQNVEIFDTRITGIAIESVDGAVIDGVFIKNVKMKNVNAPLFIHVGKRMRGPAGRDIGEIKNVVIENVIAEGPYEPYEIIAWNYFSYKDNDTYQYPWIFGKAESFDDTNEGNTAESDWQMTSNMCGLKGHTLKNITLRNISLQLDGGVKNFKREVPEDAQDYPEVYVYGRILPAKGIYFRHIEGLTLQNVVVKTYRDDKREDFIFDSVTNLLVK